MGVRILIVDDDALVRSDLRLILEAEPGFTVIGEAKGGDEAVAMVQALHPDVVLIDIHLPNKDCIKATRRISGMSNTRVLILTSFAEESLSKKAKEAGASGFLPKRTPAERVAGKIRALAGR